MIVAGLQLDIAWEEPEQSFARAEALARRAAAAGARLLVLPEMFATGFSMNAPRVVAHAERTVDYLRELARRLGVWVAGGYAEPGEERPRNACSVFSPEGEEALHYQKIHPFSLAGEQRHYEAGDRMVTGLIEGVRVTPLICYDLRFPELFRAAADATDLFLVIANWPERRSHAWRTLVRARAIDAQAWVLGVNRVGVAEGHRHLGDSALVDPMGIEVASARDQEGVVMGEVDAEQVREARVRFGFLADRRRELYRRLEDEE